jgi:integration host factor subunit alpha
MQKKKRTNLTKKDIADNISIKLGIPTTYSSKLLDDFINILIMGIKKNKVLKINQLGTFKLSNKEERMGRNPKNNKPHLIKKRNVITFSASEALKNRINNE